MSTTPIDDYAPEVWPPQTVEQLVTDAYCYWARTSAWARAELRGRQFQLALAMFGEATVWLLLGRLVEALRVQDPAAAAALLERMRPVLSEWDLEWVEEDAVGHLVAAGVDVYRLMRASAPRPSGPGLTARAAARQQVARHVLATADQPGVDRHADYPELPDFEWAQVAALVADLRQGLLPDHDDYDAAIAALSTQPAQEQ